MDEVELLIAGVVHKTNSKESPTKKQKMDKNGGLNGGLRP
jgi:hypothetical protein